MKKYQSSEDQRFSWGVLSLVTFFAQAKKVTEHYKRSILMKFLQSPFSTQGEAISLEALLEAREQRALLQQQCLSQYGETVLSLTLLAMGAVKKNALLDYVFAKSLEKLTALFAELGVTPTAKFIRPLATGNEGIFVLPIDAKTLKQACIQLEDSSPLARLWDIDVIDPQGNLLSRAEFGYPPRLCLLCGENAKICARNRQHSLTELSQEMQRRALQHHLAEQVGELAYQALRKEAYLTPKAGLVDQANNGSHNDMDLAMLECSAITLKPFFSQFVLTGIATAHLPALQILAKIRPLGVQAEQAMFKATNGVNTHKGAIFAFGLVCTAIGRLLMLNNEIDVQQILATSASLVNGIMDELKMPSKNTSLTVGERLFQQYGLTGARGEAEQGFPHIQHYALPILHAQQPKDESHRLLLALLNLMAHNPDTTTVNRGGIAGLQWLQQQAKSLLADQQNWQDKDHLIQQLNQFDRTCIERNLTAGGSADLLALSYFLTNLEIGSWA